MTTNIKLTVGSEHCGFLYENRMEVSKKDAVFHLFRHKKTGMQLAWLENDEPDKTFCIGFRTYPSDDTGVLHIIEHSVLQGSRLFPLRSSFDLLDKSALTSFLNAMTLASATIYPVCSPSEEELLQLARFYLDSVFFPKAVSDPSIFRQEGWRYEFSEDGSLKGVNGVVFNEMQKRSSGYRGELYSRMSAALFPDTPYAYSAGGVPQKIIELSYEQFVSTYRQFYYPGNALVFLMGSVDLPLFLEMIDKEFLSFFDFRAAVPVPQLQSPVSAPLETGFYIAENAESLPVYAIGFGISESLDEEDPKHVAISAILSLLGQRDQPLYRALVSSGLAMDFSLSFLPLCPGQGLVSLHVLGAKEEQIPEIRAAVTSALEEQLSLGLDKELLVSILDSEELSEKKWPVSNDPYGVDEANAVMKYWASGYSLANAYKEKTYCAQLREKLDSCYFEQLCREVLLDNQYQVSYYLRPSLSLAEEKRQTLEQSIQSRFSVLSDEVKSKLREEYKTELSSKNIDESSEWPKYYKQPTLASLDRFPKKWLLEKSSLLGSTVLSRQEDTDGVLYITLLFDLSDLTPQELLLGSTFFDMFRKVETSKTPLSALEAKRFRYLDSEMSFTTAYPSPSGISQESTRYYCFQFSTLERNLLPALDLVTEMLTASRFTDSTYLKGLLSHATDNFLFWMNYIPEILAEGILHAQVNTSCAVWPYTNSIGTEKYRYYKELLEKTDFTSSAAQVYTLQKRIFTADRLTVSVVGNADKFAPDIISYCKSVLPAGSPLNSSVISLRPRRNEAILTSGASSSANLLLPLPGYDVDSGLCTVASRIIRSEYLWNEIRVKGGAYGSGIRFAENAALLYSFSDPSCAASLSLFRTVPAWLRRYCASNPDISGHILSASVGRRLHGINRINTAVYNAMSGITYEDFCRRREELLSATPAKIADLADRMEAALQDSSFCVIADQGQIDACHPDIVTAL